MKNELPHFGCWKSLSPFLASKPQFCLAPFLIFAQKKSPMSCCYVLLQRIPHPFLLSSQSCAGPRPRRVDAIGSIGSRTREFRMSGRLRIRDPQQTPVAVAVSGCSSPQLTWENYDQDWWSNLIHAHTIHLALGDPDWGTRHPWALTWISDQRPYSARMMAWLSGCVENTKTFSSPQADSWPPQGGQSWWS